VLSSLLRFEWRYHTRQASFYAASLLFLLMGFALTGTRFGPENVRVNSPWLVMEGLGLLSLLSLFAVAIFASNAVLRDVEHSMLEIVYTTPVGRFHYLFGRFAGAALATMTVASLTVVGMLVASFMPWINPERLGPFTLIPYLWALFVVMLPNVLFGTALLFAIAALTRSAVATYVGAVIGYVLYFAISALTNSPLMAAAKPGAGGGTAVALLDPFALSSFFEVTRYWSIAEKNDRFVALTGSLLTNRILWLAMASAIFAFVYSTFSFRVLRRSRRRDRGAARAEAIEAATPIATSRAKQAAPRIHPSWFSSYLSATKIEWRALVWNLPFLLLLLLWMGLVGSELYSDLFRAEYQTALYPTTSLVIRTLRQPLQLFGTILLLYLSAEVLWRERRHRMASIIDTTPVPGTAMIVAKWTALAGMIAAVITSGIAIGVMLQLSKGYTSFEPLLYLSLFYFSGFPLLLLAAAATLIHVFSPGKYAGMVLVVLFVVYTRAASSIGLSHQLWQFGSVPTVQHFDMDGFGPNAAVFGWLVLHWSLFAALFLTIASLAWRGIGDSWRDQLRLVFRRSTRRQRSLIATLVTLSLLSTGWLYYNMNVLNDYATQAEVNDWRTVYEKTYRRLAAMPQPSVTDIDLSLEFYPQEGRYHVAATQQLANQTRSPIRTIWVAVRREAKNVKLSMKGARLLETDSRYGMHRFEFDAPLAPGGSTEFRYDLELARPGFEEGTQDNPILSNGTFLIGFRVFPTFGYRRGYEMTDARERAKRGLPPREATDEESDAFQASQESRVNLTATLSTSKDQTAIGVGRLEKTWEQGDRRYFRYRTVSPIANDAAFGSGRFAIAKRRVGAVDVEIYSHPGHPQNVERMLDAAVASIRTFESSFGPYKQGVLRLVEVPRQPFAGYASPGVIWFVENRSFLTDARDPNRPDMTSRRVVHEVAHQWWGHQLVPPNGPGASMLVETFAKHSESMIIERLRGRRHLDRFLEMELDRYLSGRSSEGNVEDPLVEVDTQSYIYYAKGAVVMNAITREIGEKALNEAIRGALHKPFPTALDFVAEVRKVTPAASYPLIKEWLTEITLYDLQLESSKARRRPDGKYDVTLRIKAGKTRADRRGEERPEPFREVVEIEVYANDESTLLSQKIALRDGSQDLTITVDQLPDSVVLDPHVTRIDKNRGDNEKRIEVN
jgi:ABC-2 type transport system permease protein